MRGNMPILRMTFPLSAGTTDLIGLWWVEGNESASALRDVSHGAPVFTHLPHVPQNQRPRGCPLPVCVSTNSLSVPSRSSMVTFSSSIIRLLDT